METKEILDKVAEKTNELLNSANVAKAADVETLKSDIATLKANDKSGENADKLSEIEKSIGSLSDQMKSFAPKNEAAEKSVFEVLTEKQADIAKAADSRGAVKFTVKANVTRASVTDHTLAYRLNDIGELAVGATPWEAFFNTVDVGSNSNGVVRYVDQSAITRGADFKAEGAAFPESAIAWQEYTLNIEKIVDSIPVTYESLKDINFVNGQINQLMNVNLAQKTSAGLAVGSGVSPIIKGVYTYAPTFNAGAYAGITTANASIFDLLSILKVEITNAKEKKYMPSFVGMNPADVLRELLHKDTASGRDSQIVERGGQMYVAGMLVIEDPNIVANTMVLGDSRFATIYKTGGVDIEMGYVNAQFTSDFATIKARKRLALLIRNADLDGFLKVTDLDAAVTAITTV